jgi:hypothetical protein
MRRDVKTHDRHGLWRHGLWPLSVVAVLVFLNLFGREHSYVSHAHWGKTVLYLPSYRHGCPLTYLERDGQVHTDGRMADTSRFPFDDAVVRYRSPTRLLLNAVFGLLMVILCSTLLSVHARTFRGS